MKKRKKKKSILIEKTSSDIVQHYRAGLQNILFEVFTDGLIIYEQIRTVESENHGADVLDFVDADIESGKIQMFTMKKLRELSVHQVFEGHMKENRYYYTPGDMGRFMLSH